jgi:hypothetical protein
MSKQFKTIKPIAAKQNLWSSLDIPVGTILQQVTDSKNLTHPIKGIVVEYNNQTIGMPYEYIIPNYEYKTTILLLHGFNSAPENKKAIINQWLIDNNLSDRIDLIAPQLNYNPNEAIKQIGSIIQEHYGNIIVIGTSLGGFYANYVRAMNQTDQIKVHAINPSWSPSLSLKRDFSLHLANADELLSFGDMLSYLNENNVPNELYYYNTNHRFETVNELLENIKNDLIP